MNRPPILKTIPILIALIAIIGGAIFLAQKGKPPLPEPEHLDGRAEMPTLQLKNTTYKHLYKSPKDNKVFLRFIIEQPPRGDLEGFLYKAMAPKNQIKAVHVVVKGKTAGDKPVVMQMSNLKYKMDMSQGFREYYVKNIDMMHLSGINDPIWEYDWISFDVELNFPLRATRAEQEAFMEPLLNAGGIRRYDSVYQRESSDSQYDEYFNKIASPK